MKKLDEIPKKQNFKVPHGYFDNLDDRIIDAINKNSSSKSRIFDLLKPYLYASASLIILILSIKLVLSLLVEKQKSSSISLVSEQISFLDAYIYNIENDEMLLMEFNEEYNTHESNFSITELTSSDIEEYLSNYYIEYEILNQ